MRIRHWNRKSDGTVKCGEAAGPKAQERAVSSSMPEWELVAGSQDRRSRGSERIPYSILDGEMLWKGGDGSSTRGRLSVWTERSA